MGSIASLPMIVQPHPFRQAHVNALAPAGATIAQAVASLDFPPMMGAYIRVWVGDWEVPRDLWATARPKPEMQVFIRVFPHGGGGGKNPLATVLSLAVMFVAPQVGPLLWAEAGAAQVFGSVTLNAITGVAFSLVANMAISALVGTPHQLPETSISAGQAAPPSYALTGVSNQYRPYAAIPRIFGKRRIYPMLAARPYSESQGAERYVRLLLLAGYGPLSISDIRIGETPIAEFQGIQTEITEGGPVGWAGNNTITLYTRSIHEDTQSIALTYAGGWQLLQTQVNTVAISIDISFPRGLIAVDGQGNHLLRTVWFEVQYRRVGDAAWLTPTWVNGADTGMEISGEITVTAASQAALAASGHWYTPAAAAYEVRVRRAAADGSDYMVDTCFWSALRSMKDDAPVRQTQVCLIAMRIRISSQFNGAPDTINCIAESWLPTWSGTAWAWQKTRNPAWAALDMLRRRGPQTLIADSRIDLAGYLAFAQACDATPANGPAPAWTYDAVLDGGSLFSAMRDVVSHARATRTMKDGKHSIVMDASQSVPIQHISPRNSWGYSGAKRFIDQPHALHVKFINEAMAWQEDVLTVYADGYSADTAELFETVEYYGCSRADQAWRIGRYLLAVGVLRPEDHTIYLDIESLRCTLGDLVRFSHDVILVGLCSGRLLSVASSAGFVTSLHLDSPVDMALDVSYAIRCRRSNGTSIIMAVQTVWGTDQTTLTLTTPVADALAPAAGDLFQFGESGIESMPAIVRKIERGPDLTAKLTLVDAAPGVWTADQGTIPAFTSWITSGISARDQRPAAPVISLRSDESCLIRLADSTLVERIGVSIAPAAAGGVAIASYELRWRQTGSSSWEPIQLVADAGATGWISPVRMWADYDVQARGISPFGITGDWAQAAPHRVVGKSSPPPAATAFSVIEQPLGVREFFWAVDGAPLDLAGWVIRYSPGGTHRPWEQMAELLLVDSAQARTILTTNPIGDGVYVFAIKAKDVIGNFSVLPMYADAIFDAQSLGTLAVYEFAHQIGWPGAKTNCYLDAGALVNSGTLTWNDFAAVSWADADMPWANSSSVMSYVTEEMDSGAVASHAYRVASVSSGSTGVEERHSNDGITWSGWAPVGGTPITTRYFQFRFTTTSDEDAVLYRAQALVYA